MGPSAPEAEPARLEPARCSTGVPGVEGVLREREWEREEWEWEREEESEAEGGR